MRHRLPRRASLKHRKWIRALFDRSHPKANSVASGCIRLVFRYVSDVTPSESGRIFVGFSPGSQIRGAVKRNRVKRLLRECYRLEQDILQRALPNRREALTLMVIFRGSGPPSMEAIRADVRQALASLALHLPV